MKLSTSLFISFLALTALLAEIFLYAVPIFWKSLAHETQEFPKITYFFKSAMLLTAVTGLLAPPAALAERFFERRHLSRRLLLGALFLAAFALLLNAPSFDAPPPAENHGALQFPSSALPHYDAEKYCRSLPGAKTSAEMLYHACFDAEQRNYDALKESREELVPEALARCDRAVRTGAAGSYTMLRACLLQGAPRGEEAPPRTFVY